MLVMTTRQHADMLAMARSSLVQCHTCCLQGSSVPRVLHLRKHYTEASFLPAWRMCLAARLAPCCVDKHIPHLLRPSTPSLGLCLPDAVPCALLRREPHPPPAPAKYPGGQVCGHCGLCVLRPAHGARGVCVCVCACVCVLVCVCVCVHMCVCCACMLLYVKVRMGTRTFADRMDVLL